MIKNLLKVQRDFEIKPMKNPHNFAHPFYIQNVLKNFIDN